MSQTWFSPHFSLSTVKPYQVLRVPHEHVPHSPCHSVFRPSPSTTLGFQQQLPVWFLSFSVWHTSVSPSCWPEWMQVWLCHFLFQNLLGLTLQKRNPSFFVCFCVILVCFKTALKALLCSQHRSTNNFLKMEVRSWWSFVPDTYLALCLAQSKAKVFTMAERLGLFWLFLSLWHHLPLLLSLSQPHWLPEVLGVPWHAPPRAWLTAFPELLSPDHSMVCFLISNVPFPVRSSLTILFEIRNSLS